MDLSMLMDFPEIDGDVRSVQQELGATFDDDGLARSFSNTQQVVEALQGGAVLVDQSHWGRLRVTGEERLAFLHNQSTNDFKGMLAGQGCDTVFVTSSARCLDLATAMVGERHVLLLVSPAMRASLLQRMDKFIFPADQVQVQDVSSRCVTLTVAGPNAGMILADLAGAALTVLGAPYGTHQLLAYSDAKAPVVVMAGQGLAGPSGTPGGYTLIADESVAGALYSTLVDRGCVPMGEDDWEAQRVVAGRPAAGAELTEDFNPLEAALCHAVSVTKGCYIGQETLSKLTLQDAVKQQLWGLRLGAPAAAGDAITSGGEKVGRLTSVATLPPAEQGQAPQLVGLGYVRSRSKGAQVALEGITVEVGGTPATVVAIPFATRRLRVQPAASKSSVAPPVAAPGGGDVDTLVLRAEEARRQKEAAAAAEAAAKTLRLEAMQKRLADWQAQQLQAQQEQVK